MIAQSNIIKKEQEFLTTGQVAAHCGVNFRTVIRWIQRGYLLAYRLPGRGDHRVSREEFLRFLQENKLKLPQEFLLPKKLVLIVDDDEAMAKSIERIFRRMGYETEIALDGFYAGFIMNQKKPSLITLDLKMKDLNGFAVLKIIKKTPELKHTKTLIVSGDTEENIKKAISLGAHSSLKKPFSSEELQAKVNELLGKEVLYEPR